MDVDPDVMRARLDARVASRVVPVLGSLAAAFAFFAMMTAIFQPPGGLPWLLAADALGAIVLGGATLWLHRRPLAPRRSNAIILLALLLALGASLLAVHLLDLPEQTTNILLLDLGASIVLISPASVIAFLAISLVGWTAIAVQHGWSEVWLNAGLAVVATSIMSALLQIVRVRDMRETEGLAIANDQKAVSLERALERERAHARDLAAANDSLEAFTYVVSHDLKEPLRGLRVYLEDLGETLPAGEPRGRYDRVVDSERRLERLVQGLLEWSRASTTPAETHRVSIVDFLDEPTTRQLFDHLLQERRARLLIDRDVPDVEAVPALLRQALGNLILNALRHNARADPQIRVYAAPDGPRGLIDIVVEDNGPGYPPAVIQRVEALKNRPSSVRGGFGLAIARRAAERMGGELHLSNAEGGGARAHLLLPAARERRRNSLSVPL